MIEEIGFFFTKTMLDIIIVAQDLSLDNGVEAILSAPRRRLLFHDEITKVFIVLTCQNDFLKLQHMKLASYLSCTVNGWIGDVQKYGSHVSSKEEENSGKEHPNEGVNFFFSVLNSQKMIFEWNDGHAVIIWGTEIQIPFPRIRTSIPKVQLIVSITVKPEALVMFNEEEGIKRDYMSINVLESLSSETMVYGVTPFLSMSRVSNISIASNTDLSSSTQILRKVIRRVFSCRSAISLRTRSSMTMIPNFQRILLGIDIESCFLKQLSVLIEDIEIKVKGQIAQKIENETKFPITLSFQEQFFMLYYIPFDPSIDQGITDLLTLPVTIFVKMRPRLLDTNYTLLLMSQWHTTIHISKDQTQVSLYRSVIHTEAKTLNSSLFLQKSLINTNNNLSKSRSPSLSNTKSPFLNISFTFTAPKYVRIWKIFEVKIALVNQSTVSKDIFLSVLSKAHDIDYNNLPFISEKDSCFLLEENAIYTLHKHISVNPVHVLPLVNNIHIGPLDSYGCYFCSISFIAIREGLFSFDGIRIHDIKTGSYIDCYSLPNIFVY
ncbi:hypothetical protein PNEG_02138 [Pneumocystis murina B123]|uniref:Trafficking protein particle complex II-specific subunit 65 IgD3 domain-containing protein n=1 Tax=Pneumocystis murina (strain B123) TaxID=1069680 RepID=M7NQK6_PNEMU|nr:hypothetical protein PNEG_02138 [Pneumocystis murina B123]EMR09552.1 hypothetical protein PNEG_02138 [Pneumocystis murina B123]